MRFRKETLPPVVELKVVILGKEFGGKTSLVQRYLNHRYSGDNKYQNTIGAAFGAKEVMVGNRRVVVGVWDTAGSERYEAMSRMFYRGARAAVVCYAVNDPDSWTRLKFWVAELQKMEPDCSRIYVVATKLDLIGGNNKKRAVDYHDTTDYVDDIHGQLFETSSKDDTGISELFDKIATDYIEDGDVDPSVLVSQYPHVTLTNNKGEKKSKCCG